MKEKKKREEEKNCTQMCGNLSNVQRLTVVALIVFMINFNLHVPYHLYSVQGNVK